MPPARAVGSGLAGAMPPTGRLRVAGGRVTEYAHLNPELPIAEHRDGTTYTLAALSGRAVGTF